VLDLVWLAERKGGVPWEWMLLLLSRSGSRCDLGENEGGATPGWRGIVEAAAPVLHGERRSLLVSAWLFASGLTHPSFARGTLPNKFVRDEAIEDMREAQLRRTRRG